jgi:hypothetical protein
MTKIELIKGDLAQCLNAKSIKWINNNTILVDGVYTSVKHDKMAFLLHEDKLCAESFECLMQFVYFIDDPDIVALLKDKVLPPEVMYLLKMEELEEWHRDYIYYEWNPKKLKEWQANYRQIKESMDHWYQLSDTSWFEIEDYPDYDLDDE